MKRARLLVLTGSPGVTVLSRSVMVVMVEEAEKVCGDCSDSGDERN